MQRKPSVVTANAGVLAIQSYCQAHGLIFQAEPREDYGVDCYIEVCEDKTPLNFIVAVQSKAGPSYRYDPVDQPGTFRIYVDDDHIEYWTISNIPVFFTFLDEKGALWWKHVQDYFKDGREEKHIDFTELDRADASLANYLRTLQAATPNVSHRLKIVRAKEPVLVVNGTRIPLSYQGLTENGIPFSSLDIAPRIKNYGESAIPEWNAILSTCIVGMSAGGRWIGYIVASAEGGRGSGYDFWLLDRENWAQACYPILSIGEQDGEDPLVTSEQMASRISMIRSVSDRVGLTPVGIIDADESFSTTETGRTFLEVDFAGLSFLFATEGSLARSYLHLRCDRFVPTRSIRVLAVNNSPNYLSEEELLDREEPEYTVVKSFNRIYAVFVSQCGRFISVMIGTNAENACWGTVDYTFVHLSLDDLRATCLDCISR